MNMSEILIIVALYAERRYFWHIVNSFAYMAEKEKNLSSRFMKYISVVQKEMDSLYLEASDSYYEVKHICAMMGTEPEVIFAEELKKIRNGEL